MNNPVKLFYSNFCEGSKMLINYISMNDALQGKVEMICVEDYYMKTGNFPEGLRGTPTIYIENDDHIDAKMHNDAFTYLKKMANPSVEQPSVYDSIPIQSPEQTNSETNYGSMKKSFGKPSNISPLKPVQPGPPLPDFSKSGGKPPDGYNPFAIKVEKGNNNKDSLDKIAEELQNNRYNNTDQAIQM